MLSGRRLQNFNKFNEYMNQVRHLITGYSSDPQLLFDHSVVKVIIYLKNDYKISVQLSVKGTSDFDLFVLAVLDKKTKTFESKDSLISNSGYGYEDLVQLIKKVSELK